MVAPSLLSADFSRLGEEVDRVLDAGVRLIHFDVMDGHFVPSMGFSPDVIAALRPRSRLPFHVHLMVENPLSFLDDMAKAGCDIFVFHVEATRYPRRMVDQVRDAGMQCGIAVNPGTPLDHLADGHGAEQVLAMGVEPGFAGQGFFRDTPRRIGEMRRRIGTSVEIGLDGHVNAETSAASMAQGASLFICGTSALFGRPGGYEANVRQLRHALTTSTPKGGAEGGRRSHQS